MRFFMLFALVLNCLILHVAAQANEAPKLSCDAFFAAYREAANSSNLPLTALEPVSLTGHTRIYTSLLDGLIACSSYGTLGQAELCAQDSADTYSASFAREFEVYATTLIAATGASPGEARHMYGVLVGRAKSNGKQQILSEDRLNAVGYTEGGQQTRMYFTVEEDSEAASGRLVCLRVTDGR